MSMKTGLFANMRKTISMGCVANKTHTNPHTKKRLNLSTSRAKGNIQAFLNIETFLKYAEIALHV